MLIFIYFTVSTQKFFVHSLYTGTYYLRFVFFSDFAMVPKYIYLENVWHKHLFNPVRLTLSMFSNV